jgi:predicted lipoprotein
MSFTLILTLISTFVPILQKYIGTDGENLAQSGLSALGTIITAWATKSPVSEMQASLTALQNILTALGKDTSTDPTTLALIAEIDKIIQAAITGYEQVETSGVNAGALVVPPAVA